MMCHDLRQALLNFALCLTKIFKYYNGFVTHNACKSKTDLTNYRSLGKRAIRFLQI